MKVLIVSFFLVLCCFSIFFDDAPSKEQQSTQRSELVEVHPSTHTQLDTISIEDEVIPQSSKK